MKTKQLFYFAVFFLAVTSFGQTKIIFHKSHSGAMTDFEPTQPGNFGMIDPQFLINYIEKVNDSTVIFYQNYGSKKNEIDTILNEPLWIGEHINLDSLKQAYPNATFVGFDDTDKQQVKSSFFRSESNENNGLLVLVIFIGLTGSLYAKWLYQKQLVSGT